MNSMSSPRTSSRSNSPPQGAVLPCRSAVPSFGRPIHLNTVRFIIALLSLLILMFVVVMTFVILGWRGSVPVENLMRVLEVLFAPLVALVGVAVAFYYRGNPPSP